MSMNHEPPVADSVRQGHDLVTPSAASAAPTEVLFGGGRRLTEETDALRQTRLRAAGLFIFFALAAGILRDSLVGDNTVRPLQTAVMFALAAQVLMLSERISISGRRLRLFEYGIFGLSAFVFAVRQYHTTLDALGHEGVGGVQAAAKDALLRSVLLMVGYGMLIPNNWRQAARVVLAIGVVPLFTEAVLLVTHPEVRRAVGTGATLERMSGNVLFMATGAGLAVYGPYVFSMLRRTAFEARRLNQYRLVRRLGVGGMGEVYLAEHSLLKRICALKLIRPERAGDAINLGRFEREVRTTARLSHPNIIEIFDYGRTEEGTFYYVMEYLPGLTLEDLVQRFGPLPAGRVIYLLRQACEALAEAHAAGLVHRDVKPANLFAARRGRRYDLTKVLDFGLVKAAAVAGPDALSYPGKSPGTPQFMAPEQVRGESVLDARCDLYALGGVAYLLLTGRPPFDAPTAVQAMIAQVRLPVEPPSALQPNVPADLERAVLRCLAKDPADRFPDAAAFERALAACPASAEWDADQAERWWQDHDPSAVAEADPRAVVRSTTDF
jgi:eukaryotic-like serine/threonine-protein kinase